MVSLPFTFHTGRFSCIILPDNPDGKEFCTVKTVSILNHKGGVGKTTVTACVSQALALTGFRVLAIDNDSQHNLSAMLGAGVHTPSIRDVYRASTADAPAVLLKSIRKTDIPDLHIITSQGGLVDADIRDTACLRGAMAACGLERFYDYVLIDNAPGMGRLQEVSILASNEIFVPTELKQFAVDGIAEMEAMLKHRFGDAARITRVIPNFYKDTKRQNSFLAALGTLFGGRVTATAIPADSVFDELVTEGKVLFLHRLYSKGAAYYLKLIHELFDFDENATWETMLEKRRLRMSEDARQRFIKRRRRETDDAHGS
ncbi:MAG: AAA family ATPase [Chitinivibrionales bacterium]|nr:AAA family ATPase [Chitinivibrionales bacterium]MBD3394145.1 AAA family ATPase [Chitinivibrionales bacterium]